MMMMIIEKVVSLFDVLYYVLGKLEHWYCVFKSCSGLEYICICLWCVGRGLTTNPTIVKEVLQNLEESQYFRFNSESKQARELD
jgi:hypothetical protein